MGFFATIMRWLQRSQTIPMAVVRKRYRDKSDEKTFMGWMVDYFDQHGKRHGKLFKRKGDADDFLDKVKPEVKARTHTPERQSITVKEAAEKWLQNCELNKLKTPTLRQYQNHVKHHIVPALGATKLSELSRPGIEKLKDRWLDSLSRPMTTKLLVSLKAILEEAMRTGRLAQNVARGVVVKHLVQDDAEEITLGETVPTKEEFGRILALVEGTRWYPLIATAGGAGLRSSELRALRWSDIDFEAGLMNVRRMADEKGKIDRPKSKAGTRSVILSKDLADVLRRWRLIS